MKNIFLALFILSNQTMAQNICEKTQISTQYLYEGETPNIVFTQLKKNILYKIIAQRGLKFSSENKIYESSVKIISSENGEINLSTQAPQSGSYSGIDPWGILWTMKEVKSSKKLNFNEIKLYVRDEKSNCLVQTLNIEVKNGPQKFTTQKIKLEKLYGFFYRPKTQGKIPAILILHGSEGQPAMDEAKWYASRGIAALAVHYFDYDPQNKFLPNLIQEIPLERFKTALDWLTKQKDIEKIILAGGSRGGELALLVGAEYSNLIAAVIAEKPSSYVWGTRANGTFSKNLPLVEEKSSWSKNNKSLPFIKMPDLLQNISKNDPNIDGYAAFEYFKAYETALNTESEKNLASIPIEKISVPIFITGFGKDSMWPSKRFLEEITEKRKKFKDDFYLLAENAGHVGGIPGFPTEPDLKYLFPNGINDHVDTKGNYIMVPEWGITGGDAQENFKAVLRVHIEKMNFLRKITGINL